MPKKNYDHLIRWTHGALVRRRIQKQIALAKLADLKYPTYEGNDLVSTDSTLFTPEDMKEMLNCKGSAKNLYWNNFFIDLGKGK
mmetsp:Transcript_22951/g.35384  ORF Transcript_22951/g.35384 Transcript_22951/m.35384 type:complete len:84 (+) Transcript_22951:72-323(+)